MVDFHNISASLPENPHGINAIRQVLLKAEQCAARG
jgi:ferritin-like protein